MPQLKRSTKILVSIFVSLTILRLLYIFIGEQLLGTNADNLLGIIFDITIFAVLLGLLNVAIKTKKHVIKIVLIVSFALLTPISLFFRIFSSYNPYEYVKCILESGSYKSIPGPLGAPKMGHQCVHTFSDGDKECTSSDECQGDCLVTENTQVTSTGMLSAKVIGGFGACAHNDRFSGCWTGTIESPIGGCI